MEKDTEDKLKGYILPEELHSAGRREDYDEPDPSSPQGCLALLLLGSATMVAGLAILYL